MSADENTPVLPVTDASARESFMYAQLAVRGVRTDSIGTALTVELSKAWDTYLDGVKAEAVAALSTPPAGDVREALAFHLFAEESTQDEEFTRRVWAKHPDEHPVKRLYFDQADSLRAAFEVRPHGTVTETPEQMAERYVSAFVGDRPDDSSTIVYRGPLLEMVTNAVREAAKAAREVHP